MKYVPCDDPAKRIGRYDVLDWARPELANRCFSDMIGEIGGPYEVAVWTAAALRTAGEGIADPSLKAAYEDSFLSVTRPGVALSSGSRSKLLHDLGASQRNMRDFMRARADRVKAYDVMLIDATLKVDNSKVNTICAISRKTVRTGDRHILVFYAFNLTTGESVCSKCYPSNTSEAVPRRLRQVVSPQGGGLSIRRWAPDARGAQGGRGRGGRDHKMALPAEEERGGA